LQGALSEGLLNILALLEKPLEINGPKPYIIMIAGINGSGKTTSIGKLAKHFQKPGQERAAGRRRHLPAAARDTDDLGRTQACR
jgi:fused signal recognition particle receptor